LAAPRRSAALDDDDLVAAVRPDEPARDPAHEHEHEPAQHGRQQPRDRETVEQRGNEAEQGGIDDDQEKLERQFRQRDF
jgi:hypothetical protein